MVVNGELALGGRAVRGGRSEMRSWHDAQRRVGGQQPLNACPAPGRLATDKEPIRSGNVAIHSIEAGPAALACTEFVLIGCSNVNRDLLLSPDNFPFRT